MEMSNLYCHWLQDNFLLTFTSFKLKLLWVLHIRDQKWCSFYLLSLVLHTILYYFSDITYLCTYSKVSNKRTQPLFFSEPSVPTLPIYDIWYDKRLQWYRSNGHLRKWWKIPAYSSVPNRRVGRNKRAGGKILKKH